MKDRKLCESLLIARVENYNSSEVLTKQIESRVRIEDYLGGFFAGSSFRPLMGNYCKK